MQPLAYARGSVNLAISTRLLPSRDRFPSEIPKAVKHTRPGSPHCSVVPSSHAEFRWHDRKSTRLNSSHLVISYAVFCLKKKKNKTKNMLVLSTKIVCGDCTVDCPSHSPCTTPARIYELRIAFLPLRLLFFFFFFNDTATTEIYTLSLHDALPICMIAWKIGPAPVTPEEFTSG